MCQGGNLIRRRAQHGRGRAPYDVRAEFGINCRYVVQAVGSVGLVRSFYAAMSVSTEAPYERLPHNCCDWQQNHQQQSCDPSSPLSNPIEHAWEVATTRPKLKRAHNHSIFKRGRNSCLLHKKYNVTVARRHDQTSHCDHSRFCQGRALGSKLNIAGNATDY